LIRLQKDLAIPGVYYSTFVYKYADERKDSLSGFVSFTEKREKNIFSMFSDRALQDYVIDMFFRMSAIYYFLKFVYFESDNVVDESKVYLANVREFVKSITSSDFEGFVEELLRVSTFFFASLR